MSFISLDLDLSLTVAVKIIDLEDGDDDIENVQREINVLSQIHGSDYVTKYYGSYIMDTQLWIVMEYLAGGSVLDLVRFEGFP
jgi:serine/threonine-protein kinase 24/25/MST4